MESQWCAQTINSLLEDDSTWHHNPGSLAFRLWAELCFQTIKYRLEHILLVEHLIHHFSDIHSVFFTWKRTHRKRKNSLHYAQQVMQCRCALRFPCRFMLMALHRPAYPSNMLLLPEFLMSLYMELALQFWVLFAVCIVIWCFLLAFWKMLVIPAVMATAKHFWTWWI